MSPKTGKKNNSPLARVITTTTDKHETGDFLGSTLTKDSEGNWLEKNGSATRFNWNGHVTWTSEVMAPVNDRRTEQLFIDTRNALCLVPAFREHIMQIRKHLSPQNESLVDLIASRLCELWKIPNGIEWCIWLINHWDPATAKFPPLSKPTPPDSFFPWTIELNYLQETETKPEVCRSVTITLNAGVSGREAQRIVKLAQKALDPSKRRVGRPRLTDMEREALRSEFEKLGIPKLRTRAAMIRKVHKSWIQSGKLELSMAVIGDELREWLIEQNQPVRRYFTEPPR